MCIDYVSAGLPPARFWEITLRVYLLEMRGAAARLQRERGLIWDGAVMARDGVKVPDRDKYAGKSARAVSTWQEQLSKWEAYAAASQPAREAL